jgi:hypothetical protein
LKETKKLVASFDKIIVSKKDHVNKMAAANKEPMNNIEKQFEFCSKNCCKNIAGGLTNKGYLCKQKQEKKSVVRRTKRALITCNQCDRQFDNLIWDACRFCDPSKKVKIFKLKN